MWLRQESNLDLMFRKHLFYPLNYGARNKSKIFSYEMIFPGFNSSIFLIIGKKRTK